MLLVFDYGYKGTTNFYTCKFFLTFFSFFSIFGYLTYNIGKFYLCARGCSLSSGRVFRWCVRWCAGCGRVS